LLFSRFLGFFHRPQPLEIDAYTAYNLWADSYPPEAHNPLMEMEQAAMLELMPELKNKVVLDLACGSGRYAQIAQAQKASLTLGMDFAPEMLAQVNTSQGRLVRTDMQSIPLKSASIDVVICGLAVGHLQNLSSAINEISRALRPGGYVVYSDIHPFGKLAGWKRKFRAGNGVEHSIRNYFHLYSDHLAAANCAGLVIEEIREPLIEGKHEWAGCPAVLVIRARKS